MKKRYDCPFRIVYERGKRGGRARGKGKKLGRKFFERKKDTS